MPVVRLRPSAYSKTEKPSPAKGRRWLSCLLCCRSSQLVQRKGFRVYLLRNVRRHGSCLDEASAANVSDTSDSYTGIYEICDVVYVESQSLIHRVGTSTCSSLSPVNNQPASDSPSPPPNLPLPPFSPRRSLLYYPLSTNTLSTKVYISLIHSSCLSFCRGLGSGCSREESTDRAAIRKVSPQDNMCVDAAAAAAVSLAVTT